MTTRVLVTGSGGLAGVNFVRALRASSKGYYIVGTDFNKYHLLYPDLDARYLSPRHSDRSFLQRIVEVARKEKADFLHPQPSSEAYVIASKRERVPCKVFLPRASVMRVGQDKLLSEKKLKAAGVPVAKTAPIKTRADIASAFSKLGRPLWARARHGAGGRLSLLCDDAAEARLWIELWVRRGAAGYGEFILQEYLPGRNIAWDSIWKDGMLVTSYSRERLEYPFKHISPSGITGTPSVSRTIRYPRLDDVAQRAVRSVDPKPNGAYSVDVKESATGIPCITEVDSGKFHSTMPLWGYIAVKHMGLPEYANLADLYVRLGMGEDLREMPPKTDLLPEGYYLLRDMDAGAYLWREDDGSKVKVL
jgi:glutathione synthase/RimK-type ligase-like ATP-grasp enzyme